MAKKKTAKRSAENTTSKNQYVSNFYSDLEKDGMLHALLLRSPKKCGKIEDIRLPVSEGDDIHLITAKDIPGKNQVETVDTQMPLLADKEVFYTGQPVAIVAGPDLKKLQILLESAEVIFEGTEAPQTEADDAAKSEDNSGTEPDAENVENAAETAETAHSESVTEAAPETEAETGAEAEIPEESFAEAPQEAEAEKSEFSEHAESETMPEPEKNKEPAEKVLYKRTVSWGDFETLFQEAPNHLENTFSFNLQKSSYTETNGAFADFSDNSLEIHTPTKWMSHLRKNLCAVLGITEDRLTIHRTPSTAEQTNSVWNNTVLSCLCAVASCCTKQPVMLSLSREEQETFIDKEPSVTITHQTAFTDEGAISAAKVSITLETSPYSPFISNFIDHLALSAYGAYKPASVYIEVKALEANVPPFAFQMQSANSQAFFALESQIYSVCTKLHLTPIEVHLKNFFPAALFARPVIPYAIESNDLFGIYESIQVKSDFLRKYSSYNFMHLTDSSYAETFPVRGIGFSTAFEGNGYYDETLNALKQKIAVTMETDGSVTVHLPQPSRSITSIWKRIVSEELEVPPESVRIDESDPELNNSALPETLMNNVNIVSTLIQKCCQGIQKQRFRTPLPITVKKGLSISNKKLWDSETFTGTPYYSTTWGAAVCEIEINPVIYEIGIRNLWITINCGKMMDKKQAQSSVLRETQYVLKNLIDKVPLVPPKIHIDFLESEDEPKQIGQLIRSIVPAAFASAVSQGIKSTIHEMPLKNSSVYRMVNPQ